jgi:hypothetical protein
MWKRLEGVAGPVLDAYLSIECGHEVIQANRPCTSGGMKVRRATPGLRMAGRWTR